MSKSREIATCERDAIVAFLRQKAKGIEQQIEDDPGGPVKNSSRRITAEALKAAAAAIEKEVHWR